jgi:hypothetical protein
VKFSNAWIVALLVQLSVQHAVAQNKPDRIRIGYAARAVLTFELVLTCVTLDVVRLYGPVEVPCHS